MNFSTRISTLLFIVSSFCVQKSFAQKTEIGLLAGGSYYWGDIVNTWQPSTINAAGSFFMRYHLNSRMAIRGSASYTKLGGADNVPQSSAFQQFRNFTFTTDIIELSGVFEYNLLEDRNKGRRIKTRFVPYVYAGLGVFRFNPKAVNPITGKELELMPLKLDGDRYSLIALNIPFGLGFRTYLTRNWQIGFDLGFRYSLSSHIDDVDGNSIYPQMKDLPNEDARIMYNPNEPRIARIRAGESSFIAGSNGKPRGKNELISDVYVIGGVTLSYRIWPKGARSYGGRAIRCPRFY